MNMREEFISFAKWFDPYARLIKYPISDEQIAEHVDTYLMSVRSKDICENIPEWLTPDVITKASNMWESHKDGDNNRVKAIRIIQEAAAESGYTIGIKKGIEIFNIYCKKN
jgi:hypothetical protein